MARRSYAQYCALARALDVVGERWTLLVVRDLVLSPKRFTDLLDGLPGIGRNLLAERLRHLEQEGIVRRRELPPPAASRVYELTDDGWELMMALTPLAAWGSRRLGTRRRGEIFKPTWIAMAMSAFYDRAAARGVNETYGFDVEGESFHVRVRDGAVEPREGSAEHADLVMRMDAETLVAILSEELPAHEAVASGLIVAEGSPVAVQNCLAIFPAGPPGGDPNRLPPSYR